MGPGFVARNGGAPPSCKAIEYARSAFVEKKGLASRFVAWPAVDFITLVPKLQFGNASLETPFRLPSRRRIQPRDAKQSFAAWVPKRSLGTRLLRPTHSDGASQPNLAALANRSRRNRREDSEFFREFAGLSADAICAENAVLKPSIGPASARNPSPFSGSNLVKESQ